MGDLSEEVDQYIEELFVDSDDGLDAAIAAANGEVVPDIAISPAQGKFLYLLAKLTGAKRILEIGTLVGYSTIWLARALPEDGEIVSLEYEPVHADLARRHLALAGLGGRASVLTGDGHDLLRQLAADGAEPFDLIFLDAEKPGYPAYLGEMLALSKPGTLLAVDNVIRKGEVLDPVDEFGQGAADFNALLAQEPSVEAVILQQTGLKGHDGLALARVK